MSKKSRQRYEEVRTGATIDEVDGPVVAGEEASSPSIVETNVIPMHPRAAEPTIDSAPAVEWIVPRGRGRPIAHAFVVGMPLTLCGSAPSEAAVYPPAPSLPKCELCEVAVGKLGGRS